MTFKELSTKDISNLTPDHPAFELEGVLKKELLPKKPVHDAEHEEMLRHWGHTNLKANKLSFRKEQGDYFVDRFWHIALHYKYWKEVGKLDEHVKAFEEKYCNLDEVPLPEKEPSQELPDY